LGLLLASDYLDSHPFHFGAAVSGAFGAVLWLAALMLALYTSILVNVLGVVAAGAAASFEIRNVVAGGLLLEKQANGWRLRFAPRYLLAGLANLTPLSTEQLMGRYAWTVLGSPSATLCLFPIALLTLPQGVFLRLLLGVNVFIAAQCCIPFTIQGRPSPAMTLMLLARKGVRAERMMAVLSLAAIDAQGIRPSGWPRDLLQAIGVPAKDTPFFDNSLLFRYAVAREGNDPEAIAEALESGLASIRKLRPDTKRWFLVTASCFQASFRKQADLAEAWLESAHKVKSTLISEEGWDSEAAGLIAIAKGDTEEAGESLTRYLEYVDARPLPLCGMLVAERARTLALLNQFVG
jgi:hypothetical protein